MLTISDRGATLRTQLCAFLAHFILVSAVEPIQSCFVWHDSNTLMPTRRNSLECYPFLIGLHRLNCTRGECHSQTCYIFSCLQGWYQVAYSRTPTSDNYVNFTSSVQSDPVRRCDSYGSHTGLSHSWEVIAVLSRLLDRFSFWPFGFQLQPAETTDCVVCVVPMAFGHPAKCVYHQNCEHDQILSLLARH